LVYYSIGTNRLDEAFIKKVIPLLPLYRRTKAEAFTKEEDRNLSIAAHILLLYGLEREGIKLNDLGFEYNSFGKPYFAGDERIQFNLSHSGFGVACAISDEAVGVDIQKTIPVREPMLKRVCSTQEVMLVMASENPSIEFTKLWTMKESYLKAEGKGISKALAGINFINTGNNTAYRDGYFLTSCIGEDYTVTVCSRKEGNNLFEEVLIEDLLKVLTTPCHVSPLSRIH